MVARNLPHRIVGRQTVSRGCLFATKPLNGHLESMVVDTDVWEPECTESLHVKF